MKIKLLAAAGTEIPGIRTKPHKDNSNWEQSRQCFSCIPCDPVVNKNDYGAPSLSFSSDHSLTGNGSRIGFPRLGQLSA
jgi:hypothetical protein